MTGKEIVVGEFDKKWLEYLKKLHAEVKRVADTLEKIHSDGIIAYPDHTTRQRR